MRKDVTLVPKDKCLLDVLAEMGKPLKHSWIFLHQNVYQHLQKSEGINVFVSDKEALIEWEATENHPYKRFVFCAIPESGSWGRIRVIRAINVAFNVLPADPKYILFLKMAE